MKNKQKQLKSKEKKQIDAITNQNKRLAALTNKDDDRKANYKKIFEELVKERFYEIKEFTDEINQNDLIYYAKSNTSRKRFYGSNNCIELFKKNKFG